MRRVYPKALTLALVINMSLFFPVGVLAARFVDMSGNWAERYVNELSDKGVLPAEKDGRFRPGDPVTRAVLSFWLVNALGIQNQPVATTPSFSDVKPSDWYYKPIEIAKQNNYIAGYSDGFRPHQFIQRGEVITILSRTLASPDPDEATVAAELKKYKDGDKVPQWAKLGVAKASAAGILINHPDPLVINAATLASRADTAALLYQLDEYNTKRSIAMATGQSGSGQQATAGPAGRQRHTWPTTTPGLPSHSPPTPRPTAARIRPAGDTGSSTRDRFKPRDNSRVTAAAILHRRAAFPRRRAVMRSHRALTGAATRRRGSTGRRAAIRRLAPTRRRDPICRAGWPWWRPEPIFAPRSSTPSILAPRNLASR